MLNMLERKVLQLLEQIRWMKSCGGDREGYIKRYGVKGTEKCYGEGGEAIYQADMQQLEYMKRGI